MLTVILCLAILALVSIVYSFWREGSSPPALKLSVLLLVVIELLRNLPVGR